MKIKSILFVLFFSSFTLFGSVEKSIIPFIDQLAIRNLEGKINQDQLSEMELVNPIIQERLRVISFNMLFDHYDHNLDPVNRWNCRKERVIEYIQWSKPDIIGSQELQPHQLEDLMCAIGDRYGYYGQPIREDGTGDIPAIFYNKERLEMSYGGTYYFSETPEKPSKSPFGNRNTMTLCQFRDKKTEHEFLVCNTHLAFGNIDRRYYEACKLRDFLLEKDFLLPVVITGDFNTFAFRQELELPFYDGESVVRTIEAGKVTDSRNLSIFGGFGPISSTNFCIETMKPFCSDMGTPGIILDHIFVSPRIKVLAHGIDPARVNGHFPSDHFPVIAELLIPQTELLPPNK